MLLQSATAFFITKCDGLLLQSATVFLLQSATSVITKCDRYYKVQQFYYKSATIITKCDSTNGLLGRRSALNITWENKRALKGSSQCSAVTSKMASKQARGGDPSAPSKIS